MGSKIAVYTDLHIGTYGSVLRSRGFRFSYKIENGQKTLEWVNKVAKEKGVVDIYCLGDLLDRADLNAEEITAIRELDISHHKFLVGNHEALSNDLFFNSTNVLKGSKIYDKPEIVRYGKTQIVMLPYVSESDRTSVTEVLDNLEVKNEDPIVIFSHNDIKNMYYGNFLTKIGYDVEDISANCDLFVNGHIHNGAWVSKKILNLGSITGINFNNNAAEWKPKMAIIDTETLEVEFVENPYGILFYKEEFTSVEKAKSFIEEIGKLENPIVVSVKCKEQHQEEISAMLDQYNFLYKRVLIDYTHQATDGSLEDSCSIVIDVDYFEKFREFVKEKYGAEEVNCKLMIDEINKIAQGGK